MNNMLAGLGYGALGFIIGACIVYLYAIMDKLSDIDTTLTKIEEDLRKQ
jgi:hypothetical protein